MKKSKLQKERRLKTLNIQQNQPSHAQYEIHCKPQSDTAVDKLSQSKIYFT